MFVNWTENDDSACSLRRMPQEPASRDTWISQKLNVTASRATDVVLLVDCPSHVPRECHSDGMRERVD